LSIGHTAVSDMVDLVEAFDHLVVGDADDRAALIASDLAKQRHHAFAALGIQTQPSKRYSHSPSDSEKGALLTPSQLDLPLGLPTVTGVRAGVLFRQRARARTDPPCSPAVA
jgi:hypothetical protein